MTKLEEQVNDIHGDMKVLKELVERHDNTLYGKQGLCSNHQRVEQRQTDCPSRKQALEGFQISTHSNRNANIIAGCALFIGVIAIVINVLS